MSVVNNKIREILKFTQLEPEAAGDLFELVKTCYDVELKALEQIAANLAAACENPVLNLPVNNNSSNLSNL